jgi:hypothetical protein
MHAGHFERERHSREAQTMTSTLRSIAITALSSGLIAIGSSLAIAQTVNNIDNTSPGESGHGTGCSNFAGGCRSSVVSTSHGAYQPTNDLGVGATPSATMGTSTSAPAEKQPFVTCMPASEATPGHCMTGGTNR